MTKGTTKGGKPNEITTVKSSVSVRAKLSPVKFPKCEEYGFSFAGFVARRIWDFSDNEMQEIFSKMEQALAQAEQAGKTELIAAFIKNLQETKFVSTVEVPTHSYLSGNKIRKWLAAQTNERYINMYAHSIYVLVGRERR